MRETRNIAPFRAKVEGCIEADLIKRFSLSNVGSIYRSQVDRQGRLIDKIREKKKDKAEEEEEHQPEIGWLAGRVGFRNWPWSKIYASSFTFHDRSASAW